MIDKKEIWKARGTTIGIGFAFSAFATFLIDKGVADDFVLSKKWLLIFSSIGFLYFASSIYHFLTTDPGEKDNVVSIVKYISTDYMSNGGFVAKPSPLLSQNLTYGVVLEESDGLERILGMAKYVMAQGNGLVQLAVVARSDNSKEVWSRLDSGETSQLRDIRIKMGIPADD